MLAGCSGAFLRRRRESVRVLALALGIPFPPVGGGLTRTFHLLKSLASCHEVVLAGFTYGEPYDAPAYPIHVEAVPWRWSTVYDEMVGADMATAERAYARLAYEDDEPWFVSVMDGAGMEEAVGRVLSAWTPDLVLLEGTPLAHFLPVIPRDVPCVLDLFDVHSVMASRAVERGDGDREALARELERTLLFERQAVQSCATCLAVSDDEAMAARTMLDAATVQVIPNGVDTAYFTPSSVRPEPGAIVFTGRMSYAPNADAACYFAEEILPLVRREIPHARFHVVGAGPPPRVSALASDAVIVHGRVDDIRPYLQNAEVVVVPVCAGAGTRLKLLEAAAAGKAIVSTRLGAEGLPFRAGEDLLIADAPPVFAAAVVELVRDGDRRASLGVRARDIACRYEWSAIGESFRAVIERIGFDVDASSTHTR